MIVREIIKGGRRGEERSVAGVCYINCISGFVVYTLNYYLPFCDNLVISFNAAAILQLACVCVSARFIERIVKGGGGRKRGGGSKQKERLVLSYHTFACFSSLSSARLIRHTHTH